MYDQSFVSIKWGKPYHGPPSFRGRLTEFSSMKPPSAGHAYQWRMSKIKCRVFNFAQCKFEHNLGTDSRSSPRNVEPLASIIVVCAAHISLRNHAKAISLRFRAQTPTLCFAEGLPMPAHEAKFGGRGGF